jgi:hypothetical protein
MQPATLRRTGVKSSGNPTNFDTGYHRIPPDTRKIPDTAGYQNQIPDTTGHRRILPDTSTVSKLARHVLLRNSPNHIKSPFTMRLN